MTKYILEIDGTSGNTDLEKAIAQLLVRVFDIFKIKQASYGSGNIAEFGERGVFIWMNDKMQRLKQLVWNKLPNPLDDESVEDTYIDLAGYAMIAIICRKGLWPE